MGDGSNISPWQPEQNRLRLAVLGKLAEECNELAARAARCIIQGIDELDPDTGRTNSTELQREIADVLACIEKAEAALIINRDHARIAAKFEGFSRWHKMLPGRKAA